MIYKYELIEARKKIVDCSGKRGSEFANLGRNCCECCREAFFGRWECVPLNFVILNISNYNHAFILIAKYNESS